MKNMVLCISNFLILVNRPGVTGAVLQTPLDKVVELVGCGSVINGAYPV